jgi:hypothetical protein
LVGDFSVGDTVRASRWHAVICQKWVGCQHWGSWHGNNISIF